MIVVEVHGRCWCWSNEHLIDRQLDRCRQFFDHFDVSAYLVGFAFQLRGSLQKQLLKLEAFILDFLSGDVVLVKGPLERTIVAALVVVA